MEASVTDPKIVWNPCSFSIVFVALRIENVHVRRRI